MTLEKARELLQIQAGFGGFYNANSCKMILAEVSREHGQAAVDALIRECQLDSLAHKGKSDAGATQSMLRCTID